MDSDGFVSSKALAQRLGMDRSHARRYVLKLGDSFHKRRTVDSGSQLTLCVTALEAEEIAVHRADQGFTASTVVAVSEVGVFYVIQLIPELDPHRLKLGFAESVEQRLAQHRTAAPTARVLHVWPCKRSWEVTAIDALTAVGCRLILNEVFECDDPEALVQRGEAFFRMLPIPTERPPLSESSPLSRQSSEAQPAEPWRARAKVSPKPWE